MTMQIIYNKIKITWSCNCLQIMIFFFSYLKPWLLEMIETIKLCANYKY